MSVVVVVVVVFFWSDDDDDEVGWVDGWAIGIDGRWCQVLLALCATWSALVE
jgi:hypothetical protein